MAEEGATGEDAAAQGADAATDAADGAADAVQPLVDPEAAPIIKIEGDLNIKEGAADLLSQSHTWFSQDNLIQIGIILVVVGVVYIISTSLRRRFREYIDTLDLKQTKKIGHAVIEGLPRLIFPGLSALALFLCMRTAAWKGWEHDLVGIAMSLLFAKLIANFASSFIYSKTIARWVSTLVWAAAALYIVGWWDDAIELLSNISFSLGKTRVSMLTIIKGIFYFIVFLWLAKGLSSVAERRIKAIDDLTPSLKVLFSKLMKISLVFIAFLLGLNAIGVDLTSFAIFGGAIGVGIGFGLQKVVSNFISGIILLLDRSIKPGDVIAVGTGPDQTFGWVNTLGARYVSIIRRDGKEHLIPNELLITEKVENWSFSNNDIRLHIDLGVSYKSDVRKAMELCLEAVEEESRIKKFPEPVIRLMGFGNSSVDLQIRGWISDPVNGVNNIKSAVLLNVWDKFHENGIEIPYPQRDLHIKSIDPEVVDRLKQEIVSELAAGAAKSKKQTAAKKKTPAKKKAASSKSKKS